MSEESFGGGGSICPMTASDSYWTKKASIELYVIGEPTDENMVLFNTATNEMVEVDMSNGGFGKSKKFKNKKEFIEYLNKRLKRWNK